MRKRIVVAIVAVAPALAVACGVDAVGVGSSGTIVDGAETGTPMGTSSSSGGDEGGMVPIDAPADVMTGPFVPSHVPAAAVDPNQPDVTMTGDVVYDSNAHAFESAQPGVLTTTPEVDVWAVGALDIPANARLVVTGKRPLVIVAARMVQIAGRIEARAKGTDSGPGGGAASPGAGKDGVEGPTRLGGGSGAGFVVAGGSSFVDVAGAGVGGSAVTTNAASMLLGGGSGGNGAILGGGPNAIYCPKRGLGGGGGGAIQISTPVRIAFASTAVVDLRGGGANGGCGDYDKLGAGGGGGAGGLLWLEGMQGVSLTGAFDMRGGGGSEGGDDVQTIRPDGHDGYDPPNLPDVGAAPGADGEGKGGAGGGGGANGVVPGNGGGGGQASGGGGGSGGRLFVRTRGLDAATTNATILGDLVVDKSL